MIKAIKRTLLNKRIDLDTKEERLIAEIASKTNIDEAAYYAKNLRPKNAKYKYGFSTYLLLLEEVNRQILNGCRDRTSKETVLANARIKVLT